MARLTRWYPPKVKPARKDVYLTRIVGLTNYDGVLRYWNGRCWSFITDYADPSPELSPRQWRGLAKEPV